MGYRPDRQAGAHQVAFRNNKKKIYATQSTCGICGAPVDFTLPYPDPGSPCIDHKVPVAKGGHPSDISNLQLAHWKCNRQKSDKLYFKAQPEKKEMTNRDLPLTTDWKNFGG